jgi:uncharacterized phage-associated protein
MFKEKKTTQMAAYLLHKAGGSMPHLKLMKLMYLADRFLYERCERPMTGDVAVSMDHGPVLSATLNLMNGNKKSDFWRSFILPIKNNELSLATDISSIKLGNLSRGDREILDDVYELYGRKSVWEVRDATHEFPEWEDPKGSSRPIAVSAILAAVGKSPSIIEGILEDLRDRDELERTLASL